MFEQVSDAWEQLRQQSGQPSQSSGSEPSHLVPEIKCNSFKPNSVQNFSEAQAPGSLNDIRNLLHLSEEKEMYVLDKSKYPESEIAANMFYAIDMTKLQPQETANAEQISESQEIETEEATQSQADETSPTDPDSQPTQSSTSCGSEPAVVQAFATNSTESQYSALPY
mmetsp:Transcript_12498/g.17317  ORF Transcript_12498/g.17317 Transcript_12498/m.17317 type:complete len:168 (+) Transcript_12498:233-736(+)